MRRNLGGAWVKGIKHYIKHEMDVEFFGSVHGLSIIFVFGFYGWLNHVDSIPFIFILQMWIVGYIIAWLQKGLFLGDRVYKKSQYKICTVIWNIGPIVILLIAQMILGWFNNAPIWVMIAFDLTMAMYFPMLWLCLAIFYKDDTNELNQLLSEFKKSSN